MQRKTRLATDLPRDWKKHVKEYARSLNRRASEDQSGSIDEDMVRLLGMEEVKTAAEILWELTAKRSYVRDRFSALIFEALYILVHTLNIPAPESRKKYETIVKSLKTTLNTPIIREGGESEHGMPLSPRCVDLIADEQSRKEIRTAISHFSALAIKAPKTKPKYDAQRIALRELRRLFRDGAGFRRPVDEAVALLLSAAFGGKWTVSIVQSRASEWKV